MEGKVPKKKVEMGSWRARYLRRSGDGRWRARYLRKVRWGGGQGPKKVEMGGWRQGT